MLDTSVKLDNICDVATGTPFEFPNHIYPCCILGISLDLSIDETNIEPSEEVDTLPTLPTFCINAVPVGFVVVKPPPDFT